MNNQPFSETFKNIFGVQPLPFTAEDRLNICIGAFIDEMGPSDSWHNLDEDQLGFIATIDRLEIDEPAPGRNEGKAIASDLYTEWLCENGYHPDDDRLDYIAEFIQSYYATRYSPWIKTVHGQQAILRLINLAEPNLASESIIDLVGHMKELADEV
jgi:hypothetical protein